MNLAVSINRRSKFSWSQVTLHVPEVFHGWAKWGSCLCRCRSRESAGHGSQQLSKTISSHKDEEDYGLHFFKIVFHVLNITLYFPCALKDEDRICPVFTFCIFVFIICLILKTTSECIYLNRLQGVLDGYSREEQCGLGYLP